jgi:glutathione S-transferase
MTIADCVTAYLMDWANEYHLINEHPRLRTYLDRMYARPTAPLRIAEAFANLQLKN